MSTLLSDLGDAGIELDPDTTRYTLDMHSESILDFTAAVAAAAARTPDAELVRFADTDTALTYAQFLQLARRTANGLSERGFRPGDHVVILLDNTVEMLVAQFACYFGGVVAVVVNSAFRGAPLARSINLTKSTLLIVDSTYLDAVQEIESELLHVRTVVIVGDAAAPPIPLCTSSALPFSALLSDNDAPPDWTPTPATTAAIMFTSGTTGPSKGCLISHRYISALASGHRQAVNLTATDTVYTPYPLCHQTAMYHDVVPVMLAGARVVIRRKFSLTSFLPDVRRYHATSACLMGTVAKLVETRLPRRADDADNPLRILWGGPLPTDRTAFEERFDVTLLGCYGSTDVGALCYERRDRPREERPSQCCGEIRDIYEVRIADTDGNPVPTGQIGELLVRSRVPHVLADGYFAMPEQTLAAWTDLWFHTGDLASLDAANRLFFLGRRREMIRRGGENISIFEISEGLEQHPAVAEAYAVGIPSPLGEDDVVAFVTLTTDAAATAPREVTVAAIRDHCRRRMAKYMLPRHIEILDEMPRTPTGKVADSILRRSALQTPTPEASA